MPFSAIHVKENYPNAEVIIFEKTKQVLSKVKISGGGRCNLTNACSDTNELTQAYPRGKRFIKRAFYTFNTKDTYQWFESKGVELMTQDDNCVFPKSQNSQSIIDLFLRETKRLNIKIILESQVKQLESNDSIITLFFKNDNKPQIFDQVIVATGGSPRRKGFLWLEKLKHQIEEPVPSLFTFNMPKEDIRDLMGIVVENATATIQGTNLESKGALLITHWGMSGPSIIKLSSLGARILNKMNYEFRVQINWINEKNNDLIRNKIQQTIKEHPRKMIRNLKAFPLPERLWVFLINKLEISSDKPWIELGKKGVNKLVSILSNDSYNIQGNTRFKEEFVTCGGISLKSINQDTMESKLVKNLYFAGEVLDIDGITGGFNFQAAWTTGFIAARLN